MGITGGKNMPFINRKILRRFKIRSQNFENCDRDDCAEYVEWLGMLALDVDVEKGSPIDFFNTYEVPVPNISLGQVRILTWSGFFSSKRLEIFFNALVKYQEENDKSWLTLYVQGFSDSVVNWADREHHYYSNGDNSYTIFLNSNNSIICRNMSTYKRYIKKQKSKFRKK
ncbi:Ribonuclease P 40kDa (Rpp40) subunit [Popillia japonica]|uniref:Ribonuclease P 40kDa (Rpp40) subunit n=1 Tax=Popillia japonica TaxID=7064 RepID=A0AAW1LVA3_POPJA